MNLRTLRGHDLFLYFLQYGKFARGRDDGTGRPEFWVPEFDLAYEKFVSANSDPPDGGSELSHEVFLILEQMMKFDYLHERVRIYLQTEVGLRRSGISKLTYDVDGLVLKLKQLRPLFQAQYSSEEKAKLRPQDVSDDLITGTGGRIVRLKDYLFNKGMPAQIPSAELLDHNGETVGWPIED